MTITAAQQGRDLHLQIEGVEAPFVIHPLPGRAGMQITETYLNGAIGGTSNEEITDALAIALDGAVKVDDIWVPVAEKDRINGNRMGDELSLTETEHVAQCAFFWQTVLGVAGVNAYIEDGGGVAGGSKALWALAMRLGLSPSRTSPSSALETLIQLANTPTTSTPTGGKPNVKQPQDRLPKQTKP
jgi:hypothetical protein